MKLSEREMSIVIVPRQRIYRDLATLFLFNVFRKFRCRLRSIHLYHAYCIIPCLRVCHDAILSVIIYSLHNRLPKKTMIIYDKRTDPQISPTIVLSLDSPRAQRHTYPTKTGAPTPLTSPLINLIIFSYAI